MKNEELFKQTFDKLHASPDTLTEVLKMTTEKNTVKYKKKHVMKRTVLLAATLIIVLGFAGIAYATDLGGIQTAIKMWIDGEQVDGTFTYSEKEINDDDGSVIMAGEYDFEYTDAEGDTQVRSGGGIAYEPVGTVRALTPEELMEEINSPEVIYEEDGKVYVTYKDQKIDITDKFEDDVCMMELNMDGQVMYMTIKYQKGFALNPDEYEDPDQFNTEEQFQE